MSRFAESVILAKKNRGERERERQTARAVQSFSKLSMILRAFRIQMGSSSLLVRQRSMIDKTDSSKDY